MKTFVKILSMLVAVIMIVSVGVVGFTAYAVPSDVLGQYDFTVVDNPYEDIRWYEENPDLHAFKASTHAHTVRSDGDIELNDTIWEHYMKGYEVFCLTDHGTVNGVDIEENGVVTGASGANGANCGWTKNQDRCALYAYQSFVHGNIDEITTSDYYQVIKGESRNGRPQALVDAGRGMFNVPLGNEANAMSGNKCHVNTYNVSVFHGASRNVEWPESTVQGAYNSGAYSHINHVGEWTDGNGDPSVYSASWIQDYVLIFTRYCPNRTDYSESSNSWNTTNVTGQRVKKGVIGMELVNTSDNRTRNDRFYVYDASLKVLAPQGINMYGFCEDDSHEESDVDKNAQYFLVNDGTAWSQKDKEYYSRYSATNGLDPWVGYTGDIVYSMTNGEFYCSSVNSKNSYELGDGFSAVGEYPSLTYFDIDDADSDKITLTVQNTAKVRLVADGNIIATQTITETPNDTTVTFDLNAYENNINSYVRIYMTGKGGITYLQPILLKKESRTQSYVQFILPSTDTTLAVYDSNGALIETKYTDNMYVLPAGTYKYVSQRKGYITKEETFNVTQAEIDAGTKKEIIVELEKDENINFTYFYAPETIYLDPADNKTFLYYIDRENSDDGPLNVSANKTTGNVYFHREGASDVTVKATYQEGATAVESYSLEPSFTKGSKLVSSIKSGVLADTIAGDEYVLIKWEAKYTYDGKTDCYSYTYSYVYPTPKGASSTLSAGSRMTVDHDLNSPIKVATSVFAYGLHKVDSTQSTGYKYAPYLNNMTGGDNDPYVSGSGYTFRTNETGGSSASAVSTSGDHGYIYADRSRINNFNEVPLLQIGFDINNAEESDSTETTPYYTFYFAEASNVLASMSGTRLDNFIGFRYITNNASADTALNYPMSNESEVRYLVHGEAKGVHMIGLPKYAGQATSVSEVYITVINTNKNDLRTTYNQAISNAYQPGWFETIAEYNTYMDSIIAAGKVLGDPGATPDEISTANKNLINAENSVQLKSGKVQIKHYWLESGKSGEIQVEEPYSFTMSDVLVASKTDIPGYSYTGMYFERYVIKTEEVDGVPTEVRTKVSEGSAEYESIIGAEERYEWIFYYKPISYLITYNTGTSDFIASGGTGAYARYRQNYTITTNKPSRDGYTFIGWYLDLDPTQTVYGSGATIQYNYLEAGQFNAKWEPLEFAVEYELNGGSFPQGEGVEPEERVATFDDTYKICTSVPERAGYHFVGWKVNGGDIYTAGGQFIWDFPADGTLVAQWSNAEYEVQFDKVADDATVTPSSIKVYYDKPYGTLATAERTGYTYEWYSDPNCQDSALVTSDTIVKIPVDHKLYAKWTPIEYTISYKLDGGLVEGVNPTKYNIETEDIIINNPEKTGYIFAGWSGTGIDSTGYVEEVKIVKGSYGNRTYVAHWEAKVFTITYNLNVEDSSFSEVSNPNPTTFKYADAFSIKPATRTGYNFDGWTGGSYNKVQTIDIAANTVAEDLSFSANWSLLKYDITYELGGGTLPADSRPTTYNIEEGAVIGNPTRVGYTFYGWQSSALDSIQKDLTIAPGSYGDIVLTAVWSSDEGEIIYELNGGTVVGGNNPTTYDSGDSFDIFPPTRNGYQFDGWNKFHVATGNNESMETGAIKSTDYGTIVFTAKWSPLPYTIKYNLDGGRYEVPTPNRTEYDADDQTFTLINPVKEGYSFLGWSGSYLNGYTKDVTIEKGSTGDREYVANWKEVNYTITYDFAGGTLASISSYNINTPTTVIGAPIRNGYTFAGWTQTFENFTWKPGELNEEGYFSTCDQHYISSPILVRNGYTYTMNSSGNPANISAFLFNENREFVKSVNIGSLDVLELPNEEFGLTDSTYFVYFVVTGEFTDAAYRDSLTVSVVNKDDALASEGKQSTVTVLQGSTGNFKLEASWNVNTYSITYDLDGGKLPTGVTNPDSFTVETPSFTITNPTKTGYNFIGWEYNGSTNSSVVINQGSTGDRDYKAIWREAIYTIEYNYGGGVVDVANPVSYSNSTETFTLNNPERAGYTFSGWSGTGISGVAKEVIIEKGSTGNRSYTATWTPDTYNIIYNLNGGNNAASNPNTYNYETETFTLAHPTKAGALFSGWNGTGLSGTEMTVTINKGSTGDRVYTANWTVSSYSIVYNLDGGTDSGNPTKYTVETPDFELKNPTKSGYTFSGWTGTGLESPTEYVVITKGSTGNRNYTATWTIRTYNINYTLGDNAQVGVPNPTSYTVESSTITLNNPVRSGYVFAGWSGTDIDSSDGKFAQTVTIYKGSTGNRNYTANWKVEEYHITYDLNGGEAIGNIEYYTINTPTFTLNNPTKVGYNFVAWSGTGITGTGLAPTVTIPTGSTGNRTYTANWELTVYQIKYELDGGTVSAPNPKEYNYLSSPITLHNPTKPGYDFVGWSATDNDADAQLIVTIPTNSVGDREYRAVWTQGSYTIEYELNGGSWKEGDTVIENFNYETPEFTVPTPVKAGYVFAGWSGTGISGTTKDLVIGTGSSGNRVYTANWAESENVITYDLAGGTISGDPNPTSYVTDSGLIILNNPIKSGYRFAGWIGTGLTEATKEVVIDTTNGGALDFTATWDKVNYRISYVLGGGALESGVTNPVNYTVESENITLNNPVRTGYTFKGWTGTALDGVQPTVTIVKGSIGARSYTAVWTETVYSISYDYGNGSVEIANPTEYTFTTPTFTLNNPVCTGYTFTGWTGTDLDKETLTVSITKGSTDDRAYVANYSRNVYTLKFLGVDDATFTAPASTYDVETEIVVPNPAKIGYVFEGWTGTGIVGKQKDLVISKGSTGNRVYTAVFSPIQYNIEYDLNSGEVSGLNPTGYTIESADFTVLNPGRAGFSFDGWTKTLVDFIWYEGTIDSTGAYVSGSGYCSMPVSLIGNEKYTFADGIALAVYSSDGTFVTLATDGTYTPAENCYCSVVVSADMTESELAAVTVTAANVKSVSISRGSMGNLNLTANWTSEKFTITYNLNNGTLPEGKTNPTEYTAETTGFELVNPTRTGYLFSGWTGTDLSNATTNVVVPTGSTGNRTYTANWKLEKYSLSIDLNGGKFNEVVPEYFTITTPTFSLPIPVKSRHTFLGWLDEEGNLLSVVTIEKGSMGAKHYTAQWAENTAGTHRIYYYGFQNQPIGYEDVQVGLVPVGKPYQVVIGYQFAGWSVSLSDPSVVNNEEDVHIYSTYKVGPAVYTITINGEAKQYSQYATVKVDAPASNSDGTFLCWKDANTNAVVSYYRSYSFKAHADVSIVAVYGSADSADKVATRITKAEYDSHHKWISFYAERSVASDCKILQHGIMFTADESIATNAEKFVLKQTGVFASSANSTSRSGVYTLSVGGLTSNGNTPYAGCDKLYARSYIIYVDANGQEKVAYSDISTFIDEVNCLDNSAKNLVS